MNWIRLPFAGLEVSPLCLGAMPFGDTIGEKESFAVLDRFAALGGNFIDTARIYSDWKPGERRRSERILGDWLAARGGASGLVIATKGAHPFIESLGVPRTSAAELRDDLEGSLRTLRLDVVDLFWLHRDDPARPVEHFVDVLNGFLREGKIRAFGASNWTAARIRAAQDYARASGQAGFAASQPLWSLGWRRAAPPPFAGLVLFDLEAYRLHRETGLPVMPYTSQAHGFFSKLALPADRRPPGLETHAYHTPPNLAAAQVASELAAAKGASVNSIVLAYLRSRPFPVVPIIGCRTPEQVAGSAATLEVRLSASELLALEEASLSGLPAEL
jgi:aryl-alcohol dehydrogenase-like predicted oxidoreductase